MDSSATLESEESLAGGGMTACLIDEAMDTVKSTNSEKSLGKDSSGNFTSSWGSPGFTEGGGKSLNDGFI